MALRQLSRGIDLGRLTVDQVMQGVAADVAALPAPAMRAVVPVLRQAERELAQGLHRWLTTVPNGAERFTTQQLRNALLNVREALKTVRGLDAHLQDGLEIAAQRAGTLATHHIRTELDAFSRVFGGSARPMPVNIAATLAEGSKTLMQRIESSARRYAGAVGDDIRRQLAIGVVKGETIEQVKRRLVGDIGFRAEVKKHILQDPAKTAQLAADRLERKYEWWAERIVRTETLNAYNETADASLRAVAKFDPEIQRRWDATSDRRTCIECRELDGRTASVDGTFLPGVSAPPLHPCCRCVVSAWRSDWK